VTTTKPDEGADVRPFRSSVQTAPVSLRGALASEWVKFRSLRSSWLLLLAGALGLVVLALIIGYNTRHLGPGMDPEDYAATSTLQGFHLDELLLGALGVLLVSGEYATGTIRATLVAVPRRLPVLWAKLLLIAPLVTLTMLASSLVAFVSSQALISHYRASASLGDPGVLRAVLGTGVYLGAITLIGAGIGWIVRSTPGALVTYLGLLLVLPVITGNLLGSWGRAIAKFLPSEAGMSILTSVRLPDLLSPASSAIVLAVWVVVTVAVAAVVLSRRDA
jgi:ABC-2 type transport system permease protein